MNVRILGTSCLLALWLLLMPGLRRALRFLRALGLLAGLLRWTRLFRSLLLE